MNDPLAAIGEVATRLVQDAVACSQNEFSVRLREAAATLRCAVAAIKRAREAAARAVNA